MPEHPNESAADPSSASSSASDAQRLWREQLASITGGLAPEVYANAWWDSSLKLALDPSRQMQRSQDALAKAWDTWQFALQAAAGQSLAPTQGDARFDSPAWQQWPFNLYARAYRNYADWWQPFWAPGNGSTPESTRNAEFVGRTMLEAASPANYLATNPELLETTRAEAGQNLVRGFSNWLEDVERTFAGKEKPTGNFVVGKDVAASPGKVVLRNALMELIQYSPATERVQAEPVLIIPAWIMKYYILDLSARNSLVKYLVDSGHTVFMVSWKNPDAADRALGMDDYLALGVFGALDAVTRILPERRVHAVGYCIGGTLLSIAAAALGARGDQRLASLTLLAAQTDFSEPGELSVFIGPSQLAMLEANMERTGVLKSEQMAGAFALLRSRDLLWMPAVNNYVRGQRDKPNDLMAWNADGTRMPCRMHSQYLRELYLNNTLAAGSFVTQGDRIDLSKISVPMFVVGTETDHVAPWRSVYKVRALTRSSDYTFLLTSGGHNAGIVSGPVHPRRRHRLLNWSNATDTLTPDDWLARAPLHNGSWWPIWEQWLTQHSAGVRVALPSMGSEEAKLVPLADAPGEYVRQK